MARQKHIIAKDEILTPAALLNAADWNLISGNCYFIVAEAGDAPNVWPAGFVGEHVKASNHQSFATAAGERLHIKAATNCVIEVYETGV